MNYRKIGKTGKINSLTDKIIAQYLKLGKTNISIFFKIICCLYDKSQNPLEAFLEHPIYREITLARKRIAINRSIRGYVSYNF